MSLDSSKINVERTLHCEAPAGGRPLQVAGIGYVSKDRSVLMESINGGSGAVLRRSEDAGKTWQVVEELKTSEPQSDGTILELDLPEFFCDPDDGRVLRINYTSLSRPDVIGWDYARALGVRTARNYTQISCDEGRTWTEPEQVIMAGPGFDEVHWTDGVYYGRNRAHMMAEHALKGRGGEIIIPFDSGRLFENGDILDPSSDPATANPDGAVLWEYGCFFGQWRRDGSGLDWSAGEKATLPRKYSCDGGDEPSMAYLDDGRLVAVLRARTYPHTGQELPSLHYYALSGDDGRTWSEGRPLLYHDGSFPYAPACFNKTFRSARNGRLYVITNFADAPCVNCDPRTKLTIGEIDTDTFRLKKRTMTIVEQLDRSAGQPDGVRFSNFRCYEERETGDVMLFMTHGAGNAGCPDGCTISPHAYQYRIRLPD